MGSTEKRGEIKQKYKESNLGGQMMTPKTRWVEADDTEVEMSNWSLGV